jgi:hypothetical protein
MQSPPLLLIAAACIASPSLAGELKYRDRLSRVVVDGVPRALEHYDAKTGRFGQGIWICQDQNVMFPLAVAYTLDVPGNRHHKDPGLLETLMKAGDALIADADADGRWVFRKKDGSTWGMIYMPWTYSRWIRAYSLIKDDMPADRRAAWEKALIHSFTGIARTELKHLHNIPTHLAMALYVAGRNLDHPEWCGQAAEYMHKVVAAQAEGGYWSEGEGPVVAYNFVYVDAVGTYYALSRDEAVRPALERAAAYHRAFTYPDGSCVETVDQRNPYHATVAPGNVGFSFSTAGRTWLANQWERAGHDPDADVAASFVLYGQEGPTEDTAPDARRVFVLKEKNAERAMTIRQGPWFVCLSAFTTPLSQSRWIQDRQNFLSIFHDRVGLIAGGGNTKLQPAWSNFTLGDMSQLRHTPGDESPRFSPAGNLVHIPSAATILHEPSPGLDLAYGPQACRIRVDIRDDRTLVCTLSGKPEDGRPLLGHLTLLPRMGSQLTTAAGEQIKLSSRPFELAPDRVKGSLRYAGCEIRLPEGASLHWPALPHNPYVKDGHAAADEGRIEIRIPLDNGSPERHVRISIEANR